MEVPARARRFEIAFNLYSQVRRSRAASHGLRATTQGPAIPPPRPGPAIQRLPRRHFSDAWKAGVALPIRSTARTATAYTWRFATYHDRDRLRRRRSPGRGRRGRPADNGQHRLPLRFHRHRGRRRPRLGSGQHSNFRGERVTFGMPLKTSTGTSSPTPPTRQIQRGEHRRLGDRGARGAEGRHRQRIRRRRSQRRLAGVPGGRSSRRRRMCAELVFDHYRKYDGPALQVMVSTDYDGGGDPTDATATWDSLWDRPRRHRRLLGHPHGGPVRLLRHGVRGLSGTPPPGPARATARASAWTTSMIVQKDRRPA